MNRGTSVTVRGTVFSGLGEGEFYVNLYARNIRRALGFTPFPGTLNIRIMPSYVDLLNERLRELKPVIVEPPRMEGIRLGRVYIFNAVLCDETVYIVRPEITVYKGDVVEIISKNYLRKKYKLEDGKIVEITV